VLNVKHYPFTSKKPRKSKCCFGRIDEATARAALPTCNIPIEVKISSRQV